MTTISNSLDASSPALGIPVEEAWSPVRTSPVPLLVPHPANGDHLSGAMAGRSKTGGKIDPFRPPQSAS